MTLDGRPYAPASPSDALRSGIVVVHQAINDNVVLTMDVLENLMIDRLCRGGSVWFRRRALRAEAQVMADVSASTCRWAGRSGSFRLPTGRWSRSRGRWRTTRSC